MNTFDETPVHCRSRMRGERSIGNSVFACSAHTPHTCTSMRYGSKTNLNPTSNGIINVHIPAELTPSILCRRTGAARSISMRAYNELNELYKCTVYTYTHILHSLIRVQLVVTMYLNLSDSCLIIISRYTCRRVVYATFNNT